MVFQYLSSSICSFVSNNCKELFYFFAQVDVILAIKLMLDINFWGAGTIIHDLYYNCSLKKPWIFCGFRRYGLHLWISTCVLFVLYIINHHKITLTYEDILQLIKDLTWTMSIVKALDHHTLFYKLERKICLFCKKSKTTNLKTIPNYCRCVCRKCAEPSEECHSCYMIHYK